CLIVPENLVPCDGDDDDQFHAIGVNCPGNGPNTFIDSTNEEFSSANNQNSLRPWRVARGFGTAEDPMAPGELLFRAREGEKFLLLSTGRLKPPNNEGVVIEDADSQKNNHNNFNDDSDSLPSPMSPEVGSNNGAGGDPGNNCDGVNDCSDSLKPNWDLGEGDPNDKIWMRFDVTVPPGVYGFEFDFVFFSSEWPVFVDEPFNDMFIAWSTSEVYTGNITFIDGKPLTVTSLDNAIQTVGYHGNPPNTYEPLLAGTGFETRGSTGWFSAQAAVTPGEDITVAFALMDMGDSNLATVVALDKWRWSCEGCIPSEIDDCEVEQVIE
ncbi:MAG: choice-of-anchor L domain-containing protein, partial [Myxococcales bacterium]|nr:choice-of-anchor L domain-containing protein [Myxococcales bacterium]